MIITLDNISAYYDDTIIFQGLGFSVGKCSIIRIKGKNGSGKTTLLKILANINKNYSGNILYDGEKRSRVLRPSVNYVGHNLGLKLDDTVENNIVFWARLTNSELMINAAINYFRLNDIVDEKCFNLSEGWQKRVALARLLACYADIWLLDEPDNNLDEEGKRRLYHAIEVRAMEGGIIFMTSHSKPDIKDIITIDIDDFCPKVLVDNDANV